MVFSFAKCHPPTDQGPFLIPNGTHPLTCHFLPTIRESSAAATAWLFPCHPILFWCDLPFLNHPCSLLLNPPHPLARRQEGPAFQQGWPLEVPGAPSQAGAALQHSRIEGRSYLDFQE